MALINGDLVKKNAAEYNDETVRNAYALMVESVARNLENEESAISLDGFSSYLQPENLLEVARNWPSENAFSQCYFQLPPPSDIFLKPSCLENDALMLVAIAARHWPEQWKVSVENIVPICEELEVMELRSKGVGE